MTQQEIKAEAQRRVAEYRNHKVDCAITSKTTIPLSLRDEQAKAYALKGIQNEIDLLDKGELYIDTEWRNRKLTNLKLIKQAIELC